MNDLIFVTFNPAVKLATATIVVTVVQRSSGAAPHVNSYSYTYAFPLPVIAIVAPPSDTTPDTT
jgi:hypothetical protein